MAGLTSNRRFATGGGTLGSSRPRTRSEAALAKFGWVADSFFKFCGLDKLGWNGMEWVTLFSRNDGSNGFLNLHDK